MNHELYQYMHEVLSKVHKTHLNRIADCSFTDMHSMFILCLNYYFERKIYEMTETCTCFFSTYSSVKSSTYMYMYILPTVSRSPQSLLMALWS